MDQGNEKVPSVPDVVFHRTDSVPQISKSVVPRFSSFKPRTPRPSPAPDALRSSRSASKATEKDAKSRGESRHERHRRHHHRKSENNERKALANAAGTSAKNTQNEGIIRSDAPGEDREDIAYFVEDKYSDDSNIRYGTADRYSVPRYQEAGRHSLLGLPRGFKTASEIDPGRRLITTGSHASSMGNATRPLRSASLKEPALFRISHSLTWDGESEAGRSYIPLTSRNTSKRRKLNNTPLRVPGDPPQEGNAVGSATTSAQGDQESTSEGSGSESEGEPVPDRVSNVRERHVQLSRHVNEKPTDVDAWLSLIEHHDIMLLEGREGLPRGMTNAESRSLADIKLSMYQKALFQAKIDSQRHRLVHGMMIEGSKIWDTKRLAAEWKAVLRQYPQDLLLWMQYLSFQQANFVTFTYEQCRAVFKELLDIIATLQTSAEVENIRIYILLRMTTFMREGGFSEHAHAIWQVILEHSFLEPSSDQAGNYLFSFEDFWDSEVPRIGEESARGWKESERNDVEQTTDPPLPSIHDRELFGSWSELERGRVQSSVLPARTLDEVDASDPYRVILFSDIKSFIFGTSEGQARTHLLEAFMCFCNLPAIPSSSLEHPLLVEDPFLNNQPDQSEHTSLAAWINQLGGQSPFVFPLPTFVTDTTTLFASDENWFNPWKRLGSNLVNTPRGKWIQRSLRQLLVALPDDELFREYVVAFEAQFEIKEARRYAKFLLKQTPSVRLYNAFALLECKAGNIGMGERIWSTALSMRSSFSAASQQDTILVWHSWLWILLDRQHFSKAMRLCLAVPDKKISLDDISQPGPAYLEAHPTSGLRAHQHLLSLLEQNLSLKNPDLSILYLGVLVILTYLTSDRGLAPSLALCTTASLHPTIAQSPHALCLLHQSRARLLHLHAITSTTGYRPKDITEPLAESIHLFPSNTIFLSLYHYHTRRSLLTDRVRDVIPTLTTPPDDHLKEVGRSGSIIPPLFRIWTELHRPTFAGSTSHSIRAAFERAVSDGLDTTTDEDAVSKSPSPGKYSPLVWKLYVLWEVRVARLTQQQPSRPQSATKKSKAKKQFSHQREQDGMERVKAVFYRAIRACPGVKEVYMLAFTIRELRESMQKSELRGVYEMMGDKGLRVHVEIERVEEMIKAVSAGSGERE
jgi:NRDE-2, necessary for RNA interference